MKESRNPGTWGRDIRQNPKGHLKVKLPRYQSLNFRWKLPRKPRKPWGKVLGKRVRGFFDGFSSLSNMSGWHRRTLFVPVTAAKRSGPSALTRHIDKRARCATLSPVPLCGYSHVTRVVRGMWGHVERPNHHCCHPDCPLTGLLCACLVVLTTPSCLFSCQRLSCEKTRRRRHPSPSGGNDTFAGIAWTPNQRLLETLVTSHCFEIWMLQSCHILSTATPDSVILHSDFETLDLWKQSLRPYSLFFGALHPLWFEISNLHLHRFSHIGLATCTACLRHGSLSVC